MNVLMSRVARERLQEIADYLQANAPEYRDLVLSRLRGRIMSLAELPYRGVPTKALHNPGVREIYEMSYRIAYLVQEDRNRVFIVIIEHRRQRRSRTLRLIAHAEACQEE